MPKQVCSHAATYPMPKQVCSHAATYGSGKVGFFVALFIYSKVFIVSIAIVVRE